MNFQMKPDPSIAAAELRPEQPLRPERPLRPRALRALGHPTYFNLVRNASLGIASLVALVLGYAVLKRIRPLPGSSAPAEESSRGLETLGSLAEENPEVVARLLTAWLDESQQPARKAA